jgi:hypothetical protein
LDLLRNSWFVSLWLGCATALRVRRTGRRDREGDAQGQSAPICADMDGSVARDAAVGQDCVGVRGVSQIAEVVAVGERHPIKCRLDLPSSQIRVAGVHVYGPRSPSAQNACIRVGGRPRPSRQRSDSTGHPSRSSQFIVPASSRPSAVLVALVAAADLGADGGSHLG